MSNFYRNIMFLCLMLGAGSVQAGGTSSLDIFAAQTVKKQGKKAREIGDNGFAFMGNGPLAADVDFSYEIPDPHGREIELTLPENTIEAINEAYSARKDGKLAFMLDGQLIFTPSVRDRIHGNKVLLSFDTIGDRLRVEQSLKEALDSK